MNSRRRIRPYPTPQLLRDYEDQDEDPLIHHKKRISPTSIAWKVCYCICFLICFACAMYQTGMLLNIYFKYPYSVAVNILTKPNITLPGITFCSSIGVRRSSLEKMPGFGVQMRELERQSELMNKTTVSGSKKQKLLDKYYIEYLNITPIDTLIVEGLNFSEFINMGETKCSLDEVFDDNGRTIEDAIQCRNHIDEDVIETFQGTQICWTLFHESKDSDLRKVAVTSGETQSPVFISDLPHEDDSAHDKNSDEDLDEENSDDGKEFEGSEESEDQPIQPLEIVRFMINFTQSESVQLNKPATGLVSVHDSDQIRLGRLQSVTLRPGKYYEIYIEEQESQLLRAPFDTNCYPYTKKTKNEGDAWDFAELPPHPLLKQPLSHSDCLYGCLGKITIQSCNCWPPEIPYVLGRVYETGENNKLLNSSLKLCDWVKRGAIMISDSPDTNETISGKDKALDAFYQCFASRKITKICQSHCLRGCDQIRVKSSSQDRIWPSEERIKYAPANETAALQEYRKCCSVVSVRMSSSEITVYAYSPKYETVEFISYVGGIVSLWLGFTFIGIFDYIKTLIKLCVRKTRESSASHEKAVRRSPIEMTLPKSPLHAFPTIPWYADFGQKTYPYRLHGVRKQISPYERPASWDIDPDELLNYRRLIHPKTKIRW